MLKMERILSVHISNYSGINSLSPTVRSSNILPRLALCSRRKIGRRISLVKLETIKQSMLIILVVWWKITCKIIPVSVTHLPNKSKPQNLMLVISPYNLPPRPQLFSNLIHRL